MTRPTPHTALAGTAGGRTRARGPAAVLLGALSLAAGSFVGLGPEEDAMAEPKPAPVTGTPQLVPDDDELRRRLTPGQYHVLREGGTEPPFANAYWNSKQAGLYVDPITGTPLFSSQQKFDSGTGWPSFTAPVDPAALRERPDDSHGMRRIEIRAAGSDSHLGHVFDDGPGPGGRRYCINSAALRFVPVARLAAEGYGAFLPAFTGQAGGGASSGPPASEPRAPRDGVGSTAPAQEAIFAGGCFWGIEEAFARIPGVVATEVGYTGGTVPEPTYAQVCTGTTGHREAVRVRFDPARVSFARLVELFWKLHDPTSRDRQGPDAGSQYGAAIYTTTAAQQAEAERARDALQRSGRLRGPIVTEVLPAAPFYRAEEYHQQYLRKHPTRGCHVDFGARDP